MTNFAPRHLIGDILNPEPYIHGYGPHGCDSREMSGTSTGPGLIDTAGLEPPNSKKARLETLQEPLNKEFPDFPFHKFKVDRVLFTDPKSKRISVVGSLDGCQEQGVVVAEKLPITKSSLPSLFSPSSSEKQFGNDVYSQYILNCKHGLGEVKAMTVYPANEDHVRKYEAQKLRIVLETPEDYQKITKPFAEKRSFSLDVRTVLPLLAYPTFVIHNMDAAILFSDLYIVGIQHTRWHGRS